MSTIRGNILAALISANTAAAGRVFESFALDAPRTDAFPFLVVQLGTQEVDGTWLGKCWVLDVYAYYGESSFEGVDALADQVRAALDHKRVLDDAGLSHIVVHSGASSGDVEDTKWRALVRPMRFYVYQMAWLTAATYDPDPIQALQSWVHATYPAIGFDPTLSSWSPSDAAPGIYWRYESEPNRETTSWGEWVDVTFRGHVLAASQPKQAEWIRRVCNQLGTPGVVVFPAGLMAGAWLRVNRPRPEYQADPWRTGQVVVTARYALTSEVIDLSDANVGGNGPVVPGPVINHVYGSAPSAGYPTPIAL